MAKRSLIFLLPPGCPFTELEKFMKREGYTRFTELKPDAGMRRFKINLA